ncbi:copper homeostasis protein CutC [Flavobacteriales bacterium]|nr:copper homeostasis protein CutC [Flavobacteriales bacterium]
MNHYLIECCANSVQSALNGGKGGANRIELCADLELGGLTPKRNDILKANAEINIPIYVLIRPKDGDFVYSDDELVKMIDDIQFCKIVGCAGVVIGALHKNGSINIQQTKQMVRAAKPMSVTFHRAFDEGNDLLKNIEDVILCGCDTLLTSGQAKNVSLGLKNLKKLVTISAGRINILAGSGVNYTNAEDLFKIGVRNFHLSGSEKNTLGVLETVSKNIQAVVEKLEDIV